MQFSSAFLKQSVCRPYRRMTMLALLCSNVAGGLAAMSDPVVGIGASRLGAWEPGPELCSAVNRAQVGLAAALDFFDQTADGAQRSRAELRIAANSAILSLEAEWTRTAAWIDRARRALVGNDAIPGAVEDSRPTLFGPVVNHGHGHVPHAAAGWMPPTESSEDPRDPSAAFEPNPSGDASAVGRRLLQTNSITNANVKAAVTEWLATPTIALAKYGPISTWNTAATANMFQLFAKAATFNGDLSQWNTASVTSLKEMFLGAAAFNGDLSKWNTARVVTASSIFQGATAFNGDISSWSTGRMTSISGAFQGAIVFNGNIDGWVANSLTSAHSAFCNATSFNSNIGRWSTAKLSSMASMFSGAAAFNQDISSWNVASTTTMAGMYVHPSISPLLSHLHIPVPIF